MINDKA